MHALIISAATSVTSNASGAQVGKIAYFPFGSTRSTIGTLDTKKLFTGQRLDDTGLYFYNARYYDATIGRFISPDSIIPNPANPQSLNRYSYCLNNPLRYTDPSGHDPSIAACTDTNGINWGYNSATGIPNVFLYPVLDFFGLVDPVPAMGAPAIAPQAPPVPVVTEPVAVSTPTPKLPRNEAQWENDVSHFLAQLYHFSRQ